MTSTWNEYLAEAENRSTRTELPGEPWTFDEEGSVWDVHGRHIAKASNEIAVVERDAVAALVSASRTDVPRLIARIHELEEALKWYANWDWSDKYVQAVPKRALAVLAKGVE